MERNEWPYITIDDMKQYDPENKQPAFSILNSYVCIPSHDKTCPSKLCTAKVVSCGQWLILAVGRFIQ